MSYILNIATAVPDYTIERADLERFYSSVSDTGNNPSFLKKLNFLNRKTMINRRHSCIPDYNGENSELYINGNYRPAVDKRMELYKKKILPLASKAIDKIFNNSGVKPKDITHLITVSCTGQLAPGMEFMISEHYGLQKAEKSAINFLGCYAAVKALKQAHYISKADPRACVLIVCAELCSLHFFPAFTDEDLVANLLFSDGAAAAIVCGEENTMLENKFVLKTDSIGSGLIPGTSDLMTWNLTSSAFRMFLSKDIVNAIKQNIQPVINSFLNHHESKITDWAIHPGGVKIVEAVQHSMNLREQDVSESMDVLRNYGNMSSPTILFILEKIFNRMKKAESPDKKIFACAFGPGINVEMMCMSSVNTQTKINQAHAVQA